MLAEPEHTSRSALPADRQIGVAEHAGPAKPTRPRKKRAPQPTYDDGATTRLFKFPSRTYPKSSYYVTSTDIIIRIKKARKKWKLVLPKKRVVSYKTNRWFAKPRWVEIELTYTQALKHGLVEPTAASAEHVPSLTEMATAGVGGSANEPVDVVPVAAEEAETPDLVREDSPADSADEDVSPESSDDGASPIAMASVDTADDVLFDVDPLDPFEEDDEHPAQSMDDEAEAEVPAAASSEATERPLPVPVASIESTSHSAVACALSQGVARHQRHGNRRLWIGCLVPALLLLIGGGARWFRDGVVTGDLPSGHGTEVTERLADGAGVPPPAVAVSAMAKEPVQEASQPSVPTVLAAAAAVSRHDDAEPAPPPVAQIEAPRPTTPSIEAVPVSAVGIAQPRVQEPAPDRTADVAAAACRSTTASVIDAVSIQFDYASASLSATGFERLDRVAAQLRSCPGLSITIAGHTDSDGHVDRNKRLSLRRAEVVRELLIDAGLEPRQLSVVGLGQTRPVAPNDSEINKRRNRRIEFVIE